VAPGGRRSRRVLTWPHLLIRELVLLLCLVSLPYLDPAPRGVGVWFARERRLANMVFAVTANWAWVWPWSG
jgi:hypothetical protein